VIEIDDGVPAKNDPFAQCGQFGSCECDLTGDCSRGVCSAQHECGLLSAFAAGAGAAVQTQNKLAAQMQNAVKVAMMDREMDFICDNRRTL
jgi:hypothetical protein